MAYPRKKPTAHAKKAVKLRLHPARDRHLEAMQVSSLLTQTYRRMYQQQATMITPEAVIDVLNNARVKFVLMGAHAIGGWMKEPRSSQDVDVLVQKRHLQMAVAAIQKAYPHLIVQDYSVVTRFIDPGTENVVIDLMKPVDAIYRSVFKNYVLVNESHLIPNLEMALVAKFAAMISPNRDYRKKLLDGADFMGIVQHSAKAINYAKLRRLGELVYRGGGTEIVKITNDVREGRRLEI